MDQPTASADQGSFRAEVVRTIGARFVALLVMVFIAETMVMAGIEILFPELGGVAAALLDAAILVLVMAVPGWFFIVNPLVTRLHQEHVDAERNQARLEEEGRKQEFEGQLHRALQMVETEDAVVRVVRRALWTASGGTSVEVLLADSSQAHMRPAARVGDEDAAYACPVGSPGACIAVRRGHHQVFTDSEALDACPCLAGRTERPTASVCVPVTIGGRAVGVLHAAAPRDEGISRRLKAAMLAVATHTGARLGTVRAMAASELAATTDPLTGLLNRRSLESRVAALQATGQLYALAMADLDHFKRLNDTYNHETGDRALQVFSRTLRACCRPDDIVARFGGEEFVVVIPGLNAEKAAGVLERVRAALPDATSRAGVPGFTVSMGVTDIQTGASLESLLRVADEALYQAKAAGRDQIVVAGAGVASPEDVSLASR